MENNTKAKRKYTKRTDKAETTTNGKIKTTIFQKHLKEFDKIVESKKLSESELVSIKYFVNYMIDEYNKENQMEKR